MQTQVEDQLFKVLREPFLKSEVFKDMFSLPSGDSEVEGSSDLNPIVLGGILPDEFKALLWAMKHPSG
jgi:hypothetical protein